MQGIDAGAIADFAREIGIPVVASGGVSSLADIAARKTYEKHGIAGALIGRARYDGGIVPAEALRVAEGAPAC